MARGKTFADLFAGYDDSEFDGSSKDEFIATMSSRYPKAEEKKYGVVGIRMEVLSA